MQPKSFFISIPFLLIWFLIFSLQAEAQTANSFFHKGKHLTYKKDYQNALSAFNQALAMDPNHIKALYERGVLRLYYLDQSELALADLQLVYQKEPGFSKIMYYNLANAQNNLGWNEIAIENFNKSLEHLPKFVCAANNRGMCKSKLGKYEEALIDFDVALKKDSKEHRKNIFINRANVFANLGQWENAKKDYENSLAIDPFNQHVFINRASWEIKRMEFGAAMNDLSIVLNLEEKIQDNSRADHFNQRGFLYFLSGNIQKAIEDDDSMQVCKEKDFQILFNYRAFASSFQQNQNKDFNCIVWDDFVGNTNNLYQGTINRKNKIPKTLGSILYSKEYQANMEPNLLVDGSPVSCKWKKSAIQQQQGFTVIPLQSDFFPLKGKHSYQLQFGSIVSQIVFINQETN